MKAKPHPISTRPIQSIEDITFDDRAVGVLALITMYQVMRFLILQVPIGIVSSIFLVLGENGALDKTTANSVSAAVTVLLELTLITVLVITGKKAFLKDFAKARVNESGAPPFTETQLEVVIAASACIAIAWSLLIGVSSMGMRVLLGIIETFAFIFLITFMTIRFLTTREIRRTAVYCLMLTALSLWLLATGF